MPYWGRYNSSQLEHIYQVTIDSLACNNITFELDKRGYYLQVSIGHVIPPKPAKP